MKIEHVAMWVLDVEKVRAFYMKYFEARSGKLYVNPVKGFSSYFLEFDGGCRLEIMSVTGIVKTEMDNQTKLSGLSHLAFSTGNKDVVDRLTEQIRQDGYRVIDEPRTTGDGYYESVILDPEQNKVEITT